MINFKKIDINCLAKTYSKLDENMDFLNPKVCQKMIDDFHIKNNCISYGGYGEDRSFIWKNSYLSETGKFIHLGIDVNLNKKSYVFVSRPTEILRIDSDIGESCGWGNRIFGRVKGTDIVLIYAHIDGIRCKVGDVVDSKNPFCHIADSSVNGGWFEHYHIQAMNINYYESFLKKDFAGLDGYGDNGDLSFFINPECFINFNCYSSN